MELEAVIDRVLDVLMAEGGQVVAEPGQLLSSLATEVFGVDVRAVAADARYCATATAVRTLEVWGFVVVVRRDEEHPQRGNRLSAIELAL